MVAFVLRSLHKVTTLLFSSGQRSEAERSGFGRDPSEKHLFLAVDVSITSLFPTYVRVSYALSPPVVTRILTLMFVLLALEYQVVNQNLNTCVRVS